MGIGKFPEMGTYCGIEKAFSISISFTSHGISFNLIKKPM